jgi:aminoglycoside/choline kinase family phosphotransferase
VHLSHAGAGRRARLDADDPALTQRLRRAAVVRAFLDRTRFTAARRAFLQGDASPRAYERLTRADGETAILLDAKARPDVPVTEARRAYMAATHLSPNEDIRPILAIGAELERHGLSVPRPLANDVPGALLLLEDLGGAFVAEAGLPVVERYGVAADVLALLHSRVLPATPRGYGVKHTLPRYSRQALETEAGLILKHFLPAALGHPATPEAIESFRAAWADAFDLVDAAPRTWTLFDYHSPNLMWLPDRDGLAQIGLLDVQDARLGPPAYDVASLAQDARVTIPESLELGLIERYLSLMRSMPGFDEAHFRTMYAICAAQRATRILGVFARLAHEDGKPGYLRHIPRISGYLGRSLQHPVLEPVKLWYQAYAPITMIEAFAARA